MDLSNLSADSFNFSLVMDSIVALVLLFSVGIAFLRGFVREILTIAGLIGGLIGAVLIGPSLQPTAAEMLGVSDPNAENLIGPIPNDLITGAIAYGGVMIVIIIALSIVSHFISKKLKETGLGPIDRTLGVFFGLARAVLVLGFLYLPLYLLMENSKRDEMFEGAVSHVYVEWSAAGVQSLLPENILPEGAEEKTETELAKFTREKLKEIDVLKDTAPKPLATDQGYEGEAREKLESLFKEQGSAYNE